MVVKEIINSERKAT